MTITYGNVRARITDAPAALKPQAVRLELPDRSVLSLEGTQQGLVVRCCEGAIWLTRQGDAQDYILSPGEKFLVQGKGLTVLQAMQDAVIAISEYY